MIEPGQGTGQNSDIAILSHLLTYYMHSSFQNRHWFLFISIIHFLLPTHTYYMHHIFKNRHKMFYYLLISKRKDLLRVFQYLTSTIETVRMMTSLSG